MSNKRSEDGINYDFAYDEKWRAAFNSEHDDITIEYQKMLAKIKQIRPNDPFI